MDGITEQDRNKIESQPLTSGIPIRDTDLTGRATGLHTRGEALAISQPLPRAGGFYPLVMKKIAMAVAFASTTGMAVTRAIAQIAS